MSLEGDTVSLADLVGSPVLLKLWATWCVPCRRETPYLQGVHERFGPRGLKVVGVSVDTRGAREDVEDFLDEFGVTYRTLHDPEMRSMDIFAAIGLPATYLIGRDGTLLWRRVGPVEEGDREFENALDKAVDGEPRQDR
jgi:thiol-disulfide isomerase/thioredoxin